MICAGDPHLWERVGERGGGGGAQPPCCGALSEEASLGCHLSSQRRSARRCSHPSILPSIHALIHPPPQPNHSIPRASQEVGDDDNDDDDDDDGSPTNRAYMYTRRVSAWVRRVWIRRHEETRQNRHEDENAPVPQPQHTLPGPGGPLHDPVTGRLRDLLQHSGTVHRRRHALSTVFFFLNLQTSTWKRSSTYYYWHWLHIRSICTVYHYGRCHFSGDRRCTRCFSSFHAALIHYRGCIGFTSHAARCLHMKCMVMRLYGSHLIVRHDATRGDGEKLVWSLTCGKQAAGA